MKESENVKMENELNIFLDELTSEVHGSSKLLTFAKRVHNFIDHAPELVRLVESHLEHVPTEIKLLLMRFIGHVVKLEGETFVPLFTKNIVLNFYHVFQEQDSIRRAQMYALRESWEGIFSSNTLSMLDLLLNLYDSRWTAPQVKNVHFNSQVLQDPSHPTARIYRELLELQMIKLEHELLRKLAEKIPTNDTDRNPPPVEEDLYEVRNRIPRQDN